MYKSPIQILTEEPQFDIDGEICRCVRKMGIEVDKEELTRALCYDRGQYEKGYNDRDAEIIRCKDCEYFSMTTLGMPYACWKGADKIFGETGEHANHTVCRRIDSPDWFCADGERRTDE